MDALPKTKREIIIEVWEKLDCDSVGANELQEIQAAVCKRFGDGAVDSPAAIARVLADEGAVLRHPEVLEFDSAWRRGSLANLFDLEFTSITEAQKSMERLQAAYREFAGDGREELVRQKAVRLKAQAKAFGQSRALTPVERQVANEVFQWLAVWINDPELFDEWLSLRQQSADFKAAFEGAG